MVDVLERNPPSILYAPSFPASTRSHKSPLPIAFFQAFQSFRSSPSLSRLMCSPRSSLVFILSAISFIFSSRREYNLQLWFHYPRALVDVLVAVNLSLLLDDHEVFLGGICLCLSTSLPPPVIRRPARSNRGRVNRVPAPYFRGPRRAG